MIDSSASIHPTAIIHESATIEAGVEVGPYAIIEHDTVVGENTRVGASAFIGPWTIIGKNNHIYHHATVGSDSQALAYKPGTRSFLKLGTGNIIREYTQLNRSSSEDRSTVIGSGNCFMAYSHVAHDCTVGDHTIFANAATIGGHVCVEDYAILGGLVGVHQECNIGRYAIIGSSSKINKDVLPFITADGHPARPKGLNAIGLRRHGFSEQSITEIRRAYKILFYKNTLLDVALEQLRSKQSSSEHVKEIVDFIEKSTRGILRTRKGLLIK